MLGHFTAAHQQHSVLQPFWMLLNLKRTNVERSLWAWGQQIFKECKLVLRTTQL